MLAVVAACGGDDLLLPSSGEPALIEIVGGNEQADTVGQTLPDSLVVRVTDPERRPVEGVEVAFVAPEGAVLAPNDTVLTGSDGRAAVYYTLPTVSGPQAVEARAKPVVPATSLTTVFSVSAVPDVPTGLIAAGGDQQEAEVLTPLDDSLAVKAVDRFGNGVAGVEVTWEASDGAVSPVSVTTGADGRSATQRTLGARPGSYRTTAVASALENSTVEFEATGIAPPSPQIVVVTQPSASAQAGIPFERQPVLQLQDAVGAPLLRADVAVTVQIADGAGSLGGTTSARSNAEGRVTFTDLSIRGPPGERTLLFAASDFTPATSEEIDVSAGPPSSGQSSVTVPDGTAGAATRITIRLKDEFGTEIEDATDAIRVGISGANSGEAGVTEEGDGVYSASYTPIRTGTDQVTVEVSGAALGGSPFSSAVEPGPASASTTTALVTKSGGFFFDISILVTTRDAQGNLRGRGGELVQVQLESGGDAREAQDNGDGTYSDRFLVIFTTPSIIITLNGVPISGSPYRP
jgi:hypothetical protein